MKKIFFLFTLAMACVVFSTERTLAAETKGSTPAEKQTIAKDKVSPELVQTTYVYYQCTDGSFEPVMSITTFTNTVGSQTVTTTVVATRSPSIGCMSYIA